MTQYRVFGFEADDSTFALNNRHLEIVRAGLYAGFDAALSAGLTLNLVHTISGVSTVDANVLNTPPKGVFLTKQGVTIKEDAAINIPIAVGNTEPRIDLIVAEHSYVKIKGGQPAIYSVIKGTPAISPVIPSLTNEKKQTLIGQIYIPANMSGLDDPLAFYTKSPTPDFGGNNHTAQIVQNVSNIAQNASDITQNSDDIVDLEAATGGLITAPPIEIGDWNMDTTEAVAVIHNLDYKKIRTVSVMIRSDDDTIYDMLDSRTVVTGSAIRGAVAFITATEIGILRVDGEYFDTTDYDTTSYNRGWITVQYVT